MTAFSEGRNNRLGFIFSAQRRSDFSKTLRSKCLTALGRLNIEDVTPELRRLEKLHHIDFSKMKPKTWLYNGEVFTSPMFIQQGKPFSINAQIKKMWLDSLPKTKVLTLKEKIKAWFKPLSVPKTQTSKQENLEQTQESFFESKKLESEESLSLEELEEKELNDTLSEEEREQLEEEQNLREIEEEMI